MYVTAGYNYYGTERFYSGIDGREMEADIFMGVVYYQRLRHMVSDKFQVRKLFDKLFALHITSTTDPFVTLIVEVLNELLVTLFFGHNISTVFNQV